MKFGKMKHDASVIVAEMSFIASITEASNLLINNEDVDAIHSENLTPPQSLIQGIFSNSLNDDPFQINPKRIRT